MRVMDMHPNVADLEAFPLGPLAAPALAAVEAHVAGCPACQERAATASGDSLVELLRRVHARTAEQTGTVSQAGAPGQTAPTVPPAAPGGVETLDFVPPELARHERYRVVRLLGEGGRGTV